MIRLSISFVIVGLLLGCASTKDGRPQWVDAPNKDLLNESKTAYYALGMAEGYSEGDLRTSAAAMARQELANYISVRIESSFKRSVQEQTSLVNAAEDVSEIVVKDILAQSNDMVLPLTTVENYYAEKLEGGKLKVYARVKLDIPVVVDQLKSLFARTIETSDAGKKLYLEGKAGQGLADLKQSLEKAF